MLCLAIRVHLDPVEGVIGMKTAVWSGHCCVSLSAAKSPSDEGNNSLPQSDGLVVVGYLARKLSRTLLISVWCVQSIPWGAPSISTYSAVGRALANSRPVASIGRMLSEVPCTMRVGTSILGM